MIRIRPLVVGLLLAIVAASPVGGLPAARAAHSTDTYRPDLVMLPPSDFSIQARGRGVRWLRFSTVIANLGPGAFQVYGYDAGGAPNGDPLSVVQQVQQPGGGFADHPTGATMFYSGDGHNHHHVRDLQAYTIQNLNAQVLGTGAKTGFCFYDNYRYGATTDPWYHPSTTDACAVAGDGTVPMGLSVGWGDRYPASIAFQYIDISGLPNGSYRVTVEADPASGGDGLFLEANEGNNASWALIRISRKSVTVLEVAPLP